MCSTAIPVSLTPTGETPSAVRPLRGATLTLAPMGNLGAGLGGIALVGDDDMAAAAAGSAAAAGAARSLAVAGALIAASDAAIAFCSGVCWSELTFSPRLLACCCCSCGDRWSELTFLPRALVSSKPGAMLPGASSSPSATGVAAHNKPNSIPRSARNPADGSAKKRKKDSARPGLSSCHLGPCAAPSCFAP